VLLNHTNPLLPVELTLAKKAEILQVLSVQLLYRTSRGVKIA
jgi:hypothetical protein